MKKWKTIKSETLFKSNYAQFRKEVCEVSDGRIMPHYYVLDVSNWVNVVAVTTEGKIILVRQYRHAAKCVTLEIPGGAIDKEDATIEAAARRELREETGFTAGSMIFSSRHYPNPALQSNELWTCVMIDCEKKFEPEFDEFEDVEVELISLPHLKDKISQGEISHSLILASLFVAWPQIEKLVR